MQHHAQDRLARLGDPVQALCSNLVLAEGPAEATKALHLLDYIGADYPPWA